MPNEATIENLNIEIEGTVSQSNTQAIRDQADALNQLSRSLQDATSNASGYTRAMSALQTPDRGASTAPIHYWTDSADNQNQNQSGSLGKSPMDWSAFYQEAQQQATAIQEAMNPDIDSLVSHFRGYNELVVRIDTAREKLTALLTSGKDINDTGVQRLVKQIQKLQDEIGKTGEKAEESGKKAKRGMSGWQKLANSFKRILMYRAIRSVLKSITTLINDGVKNVALWSDAMGDMDKFGINKTLSGYSTQIEYVKNSLGAALVPLLQSLVPIFIQITDVVVDALNAINQMIRSMQGYSTYLKAEKYDVNFADQWKNATSAAKEYQKVLAGFDELNILQSQKPTESSGMDIKNAFAQETPIDENVVTQTKWIVGIAGSIIAIVEAVKFIKWIWDIVKVISSVVQKIHDAWIAVKTFFGSTTLGSEIAGVLSSTLPTIGAFAAILGILALMEQVPDWLGVNDPDKRHQTEDYNPVGWSGVGRNEFTDNRTASLMEDSTSDLKDAVDNTAELDRLIGIFNKNRTAKNAMQLVQAYQKQTKTVETLKQQYEDLIEQQRILRQQGNDSEGIGSNLEALQTQIEHVADQLQNATDAQEDAKDALTEAGYAQLLATKANAEYVDGLKKTLETVHDLKDAEQIYSDQSKELSGIRQEINDILAKGDDLTAADIDRLAVLNQSLLNGEAALREIKQRLHEIQYESGEADNSVSSLISQLNSYKGKKIPIELAIEINAAATVAFDKSYQGGQAIIDEKKFTRAFLENPHIYDAIKQADLYANGGFVPRGDLFIANEQGAELVGRIGNQTAVANQSQIVDAVSAGVYRAMREAGGSGGETRIALMVDRKTLTEVVVDTINNTVRQTGASPLLV